LQFNNVLPCFRHANVAKLESTLEGVKKGHAIAMEELNIQLQKSLAENTRLEEQLKDQQRLGRQNQKEVDDLRQASAGFEAQWNGFNEVLGHFQKTLLGNSFSPYCALLFYNLFLEGCFTFFRYAGPLEQAEVDTASGLRTATDAARKEMDSLLDAGNGVCASLQIAGASHLSATGLSEKLQLVPGLMANWK
jgi:hypothetical protein